MSKDADNKNQSVADLSVETDDVTLEGLDDVPEANEVTLEGLDDVSEANKLLSPFDHTLEIMSQTLASIDAKMEVRNSKLKKLDKLSEIKDQLNRLENINVTNPKVSSEHEVITEATNEIEEEIDQSRIGHNQQEISELLEKIHYLENKILTVENQSNNSNKRFKRLESAVQRFEDLEIKIPSLFKNLFNKKETTNDYKNEIPLDKQDIEFKETKIITPQDKIILTEEVADVSENTTNETIINDNHIEPYIESDKTKSNNFKYIFRIFVLLFTVVIILFFTNKLQIIDLSFGRVMNGIYSLLDSFFFQLFSIF